VLGSIRYLWILLTVLKLPFRLTVAILPHTFQRVMNSTLAPLLRKCVLVFFDDILVYIKSYEEHVSHLEHVFSILHREQWSVKLSKCSFAKRQISYLGYMISGQGVATCPEKIKVVAAWPVHRIVKDLRSFLGLTGYYWKFVKGIGVIARPLNDLLKKNAIFVWTPKHEIAFNTLKSALITTPILGYA
jgi:hypothetical protein